MEGIIERTCANCKSVAYENIRLIDGRTLPYAGGMVNCHKKGVGFYPNQRNVCADWVENSESVEIGEVIRRMEEEWAESPGMVL